MKSTVLHHMVWGGVQENQKLRIFLSNEIQNWANSFFVWGGIGENTELRTFLSNKIPKWRYSDFLWGGIGENTELRTFLSNKIQNWLKSDIGMGRGRAKIIENVNFQWILRKRIVWRLWRLELIFFIFLFYYYFFFEKLISSRHSRHTTLIFIKNFI